MKGKSYGAFAQNPVNDEIDLHVEDIAIKGFTIVKNAVSSTELPSWRDKIDSIYEQQEREYGRDALMAIQELDVCRAPILYDFDFLKLATNDRVLGIVRKILGDWFILNLQNSIINRPNTDHHQRSWHRDLPYQNWVISRPLALNALYAIDDFTEQTGGTHVVPFTHKTEILPSDSYIENNLAVANAPAGSVIVFDSMLFHRAGANVSGNIRRAVNHLYTTPIFKQQYDFPRALAGKQDMDPSVARLLGMTSQVPLDDKAWRNARAAKLEQAK
jgi:ectoine hydroxylase-related dioxygenase (phytanoyl-CoA dioxygenase family)